MTLPESWRFLAPGWWAVHLLGIAIVYMLGVGHGRRQALRMMEKGAGNRSGSAADDTADSRRGEG